jgi:enolase-phosphatase E1
MKQRQPIVRGILLDIEGTTSSISFVYDEMFPFVRRLLAGFLDNNWSEAELQDCLPLLVTDLGYPSLNAWLGGKDDHEQRKLVRDGVIGLMDADIKATGLKQLQGLIWKDGFESGKLVAHVYDDVAPAIKAWHEQGIDVRVYSSGSIAAQKLFFGHCVAGNLLPLFSGHYDTTTGSKLEASSYEKIAAEFDVPAENILFVSDVAEELMAARDAGMQVVLSIRPGNRPVDVAQPFESITCFEQL